MLKRPSRFATLTQAYLFRGLALSMILGPFAGSEAAVAAPLVGSSQNGAAVSSMRLAAVFGTDNRKPVEPGRQDLQGKIGLLRDASGQSRCTAFCLASDVIATAGHCLSGPQGTDEELATRLSFDLPSQHTGLVKAASGYQLAISSRLKSIVAGASRLSVRQPITADLDWALVRLQKPVCRHGGFSLSSQTPSGRKAPGRWPDIYQVGFHDNNNPLRLVVSEPCGLGPNVLGHYRSAIGMDFANSDALMFHRCDGEGASSGAPLLADGPNGPEVVAINVGTYVRSRVLREHGEIIHRLSSVPIANTAVLNDAFRNHLRILLGHETTRGKR